MIQRGKMLLTAIWNKKNEELFDSSFRGYLNASTAAESQQPKKEAALVKIIVAGGAM